MRTEFLPTPGAYDPAALARSFAFPALGGFLYGDDIGATAVALTELASGKYSGTEVQIDGDD